MAPVLDATDRVLVAALQHDGRLSMRALAAQVHISRASAYTRVQRLERDGVIAGYSAVVDAAKLGLAVSAYIHLKVAQQAWQPLRDRLLTIGDIEHAALVSGDVDIVLLVRTPDISALRDIVLTRLQEMPEVTATQTVLIFDELARPPLTPSRDAS